MSSLGRWRVLEPSSAATLLASLEVPWWIAGGWALDLFLGETTRAHGDLDVGVLRRDVAHLQRALWSWELFQARRGELTRLMPQECPRSDANSLWCRPASPSPWLLEVLLDDSDGDTWVFRRQPAIRVSLSEVFRRTRAGIPYLAPEIQLLYKANRPRERDEADFRRTLRCLDSRSRQWLLDALRLTHPRHDWLSVLTQ